MCNALKSVGILGVGSFVPEKILTNADLEKMVDTSDEWITKRTGISERRILEREDPAYEMGVKAARRAIENANLTPEDIDLIIVATETPDYLVPSTACIIQDKIGATKAAGFDLNAACSGFMYSLTVGEQFVKTGLYKHVLVIACEALTKATDWQDRNTCISFGDGSGAVVLGEVEEGYGILSTYLGADGGLGHNITIPCFHITDEDKEKRVNNNNQVIWMDGSEVFKFAVKIMENASLRVIEDAGLSLQDIDLIIPHQANIRIIESAARRLDLPQEKLYTNLQKYGNVSSASIAVALDEAIKEKAVKRGDNFVMVGFGGGLTWGSICIRWHK